MERDMNLIREILLDIEENAKPRELYNPISAMENKGYNDDIVIEHLVLMYEAGLFSNDSKYSNIYFVVRGLSNKGYDFLETIRNDEIWNKTKTEIKEKKLPKTIKFIAEVAGIFWGEYTNHKNGN